MILYSFELNHHSSANISNLLCMRPSVISLTCMQYEQELGGRAQTPGALHLWYQSIASCYHLVWLSVAFQSESSWSISASIMEAIAIRTYLVPPSNVFKEQDITNLLLHEPRNLSFICSWSPTTAPRRTYFLPQWTNYKSRQSIYSYVAIYVTDNLMPMACWFQFSYRHCSMTLLFVRVSQ